MMKESENTRCIRNLTAIKGAMQVYSANYDGRFPPLFVEGENRSPKMINGVPNTWATVIAAQMTTSFGGFSCPSAKAEENTPTLTDPAYSKENLQVSYGMYVPRAGRPDMEVSDPSTAVLLAETANFGVRKTFDVYSYRDNKSEVPYDGMSVGWDTSNFGFDARLTKSVTRLAFYNTEKGNFNSNAAETRHAKHNNYLSVDFNLRKLTPSQAYVTTSGNRLTGIWEAR